MSKPAGRAHWDPYAADYAQHAEPELGVDLGAFFFEFGEAGQDAAAQGGDGAGVGVVAVVGEGFDLAGVGVLGGADLA